MLSRDHIAETAATFTGTEKFRIAQAAIAKVDAPSILIEPTRLAAMASPHFSHTLADELKATSQGSSGRCWIFAALNVLRYDLAKTHSLPADFELSQTYVYFYDKLERVNYFLEQCIALKDEAVDSRLFQHILTSPLGDGGQWDMLANVVAKYGVVPKSAFGETFTTKASRRMNRTLTARLRGWACALREGDKDAGELRRLKEQYLEEAQTILMIHLGTPPASFDWSFTPKKAATKKKTTTTEASGDAAEKPTPKHKPFVRHRGLTPLGFLETFCGGAASMLSKVSLVHDPRNPYFTAFTVSQLGNVVGGRDILYLNVPIAVLKNAAAAMLRKGEPVWFGCDVAKDLARQEGVMDTEMWREELVYGSTTTMSKVDRLRFGQSLMVRHNTRERGREFHVSHFTHLTPLPLSPLLQDPRDGLHWL